MISYSSSKFGFDVDKYTRDAKRQLETIGRDLDQRGRELEQRGRELEKRGRELAKRSLEHGHEVLQRTCVNQAEIEKKCFKDGILAESQTLQRQGTTSVVTEFVMEEGRGSGLTLRTSKEVQMYFYLIVYEPKGGANLQTLAKTLQKMESWWNFVERVWIVGTTETADVLWNRLTGLFGKSDNVLILELPPGPDRQGWLPEKAWDWFNKSMPRGAKKNLAPTKLGIPYGAFQSGGEVLVVPEGVKVQVTHGAEGVFFAAADDVPTAPEPVEPRTPSAYTAPIQYAAPVKIDTCSPHDPSFDTSGSARCDFCGCEAPANEWRDGECPRCGIKR